MRLIDAEKMKTELLWGNAYLSDNETNTLVDLIDNQPTIDPGSTAPRWIPVTERLPEKDKDVLVYATTKFIGGSKIAIDKLEEGELHPIWLYTHGWFEVTHWMPLPELPGGGDPDDPA